MPVNLGGIENLFPRVKSVADYDAEAQQRQQNALALQQGQLSMQDAQRKIAQAAELDAIYRGLPQGSISDQSQYLLNSRHPLAVPLGQKMQDEEAARQLKLAQAGHAKAQEQQSLSTADKTKYDTQSAVVGTYNDQLGKAADFPAFAAILAQMHADPRLGDFPKIPLDAALRNAMSMPLDEAKAKAALGVAEYLKQNKPHYVSQDTGGSLQVVGTPGLGIGDSKVVSTTPTTVSANTEATNKRIEAENEKNRQQQWGIAAMADKRSRENTAAIVSKPFEVTDPATGKTILVQQSKDGKLTPVEGYLPKTSGGSYGAREATFVSRVLTSANQAAKDLENVAALPLSANTGIFGGRKQGAGLLSATKEVLANTMTPQEAQSYNVMATGFQRSLAGIEAAGLMPTGKLTDQMDAVLFKAGDTNLTKLEKLAQTTQIVESGLETIINNPRVPDGTKDDAKRIINLLHKAVPFNHADLRSLKQGSGNLTMGEIIKRKQQQRPTQEPNAVPDGVAPTPNKPTVSNW